MDRTEKFNHDRMMALAHLPKKIVSLEGNEHTPSFVLHELCDERCFNLKKAAFFADSPEFNSLKGVAGFDGAQKFPSPDLWQDPQAFVSHLTTNGHFNDQVRQIRNNSLFKNGQLDLDRARELAHDLGITNPALNTWRMKHDNYGVLIYENQGQQLEGMQEQLDNSLYLLNFCPLI